MSISIKLQALNDKFFTSAMQIFHWLEKIRDFYNFGNL